MKKFSKFKNHNKNMFINNYFSFIGIMFSIFFVLFTLLRILGNDVMTNNYKQLKHKKIMNKENCFPLMLK